MKKHRWMVVAWMLILAMALSACSGAKNEEPPKDETPTKNEETEVETPDTNEEDKEYRFAYISKMAHVYQEPMPQAVQDACDDLGLENGVEVQYLIADGTVEGICNFYDTVAAAGVTHISSNIGDRVAMNVKISEMKEQGVTVTNWASQVEEPTDAVYTLTTDVEYAAYTATKLIIEELGGKGNIVHLAGDLVDANTTLRIEAVEKAVAEYPDVTLFRTIADVDNTANSQNAVNALLATDYDNVDGIVATGGNASVGLATALRERDEKNIVAIGVDTDELVLKAIEDGYMFGTMSQNPYGQAYCSIVGMKLMADGYTYKSDLPYIIDSGTYLINKDNVADTEALAEAATEELKAKFVTMFDPPATK